jgi:hypothetical protein
VAGLRRKLLTHMKKTDNPQTKAFEAAVTKK